MYRVSVHAPVITAHHHYHHADHHLTTASVEFHRHGDIVVGDWTIAADCRPTARHRRRHRSRRWYIHLCLCHHHIKNDVFVQTA